MLEFAHGDRARQGGTDLIISLTPEQAQSLGDDAGHLADWLNTALTAISRLRSDQQAEPRYSGWGGIITELDYYLLPRIGGALTAAIRDYVQKDGASIADVARATGVSRSTAQSRLDKLLGSPATRYEEWARGNPDAPGVTG
jgi:AraC-like DNA-binding protein